MSARRPPGARDDERGSAMMLMPAAVLILIVLGAIAVDFAILFLGERELADAAAAAANDAAVAGLDERAFYECRGLVLDSGRVQQVAGQTASARSSDAVTITGLRATSSGGDPPTVTVAASGTVDLIFSPALPGQPFSRPVAAEAIAVAEPLGPAAADGNC